MSLRRAGQAFLFAGCGGILLPASRFHVRAKRLCRFVAGHDHCHPKEGQPAGTAKLQAHKARLGKQSRKGLAAPKLDVTAVPQRIGMSIPPVRQCQKNVLCEAVIRCRANEATTGLKGAKATASISARVVEMLNNFGAHY